MDDLLKQGQSPGADLLDDADVLLRQVISEISALTPPPERPLAPALAPLAPDALRALAARLSEVLDFDLGAAESLLEALRAGVAGTALEAEVSAIATLIDVFDIDGAQLKLKTLDFSPPGKTP
jgi:hypothetical protein